MGAYADNSSAGWVVDEEPEDLREKAKRRLLPVAELIGEICAANDVQTFDFLIDSTRFMFERGLERLREAKGEGETDA